MFLGSYEKNQNFPVGREPLYKISQMGFPGGSGSKESACNGGDPGWIPGLGRSPEGNGLSLQYSCLENPMGREVGQVTVHGVSKSWI